MSFVKSRITIPPFTNNLVKNLLTNISKIMSKQRAETMDKCVVCNKTTGCDSWLSCEICDGWFHAKCVNVKEEAYKVLQELETCHWFCSACNTKMGKVIY